MLFDSLFKNYDSKDDRQESTSSPTKEQILYTSLEDVVFCFVDIETTGAKPRDNQIIEIGAIKYRNGEILDRFESYIYAKKVPCNITKLTGISKGDIKDAPKAKEVLGAFSAFVKGCVFVAHNVNFDYEFLQVSLQKNGYEVMDLPLLCTLEFSRRTILSPRYALKFLNEFLGINTPISHRAYADALSALEVFKITMRYIPQEIKTIYQLLEFIKSKNITKQLT